jgi:large subunit ribosomal protein L17
MLSNMGTSLILHKRIETTLAKAKELRVYIEPIIHRGKEDSTHNRREVFSKLRSKEAVTELFNNISGKIANRNGGYTRILKLGENRLGDNAIMCLIELVDYNENMLKTAKAGAKKRSRRGTGKSEKKAVKAEDTVVEELRLEEAAPEVTETKEENKEKE